MLHCSPAALAASASCSPRTIQVGDLVIVYEGINSMKAVSVSDRGGYENKFGYFAHKVGPGAAWPSRGLPGFRVAASRAWELPTAGLPSPATGC